MKIEHLNIIAGSSTAIRILSVWQQFIKDDLGLTLSELAAIDPVAAARWQDRLLALDIVRKDGWVDPQALTYAQQFAAQQAGIGKKKRASEPKEGESPSTTIKDESRR